MTNRRQNLIAVILISLVLVGAGGFWIYKYFNSFQVVNIAIDKGLSGTIYTSTQNDSTGITYDSKSSPLQTVNSSQSLKLKKGGYVLVLDKSTGYETNLFPFVLANQVYNLKVHPLYSNAKLAQTLKTEQPAILAAINNQYPDLSQMFSIKADKLYQLGEWYGARLGPNDPSNIDTYRIILQKKAGKWTVVTIPPQIIIGQPVYPDIPHAVLVDVNNFL